MICRHDYFADDCIGQFAARKQLSFFLEGYKRTGIFRNCLFLGQKGQGKTHLARKICTHLGRKGLEVNSSSIKSVGQLFDQILLPFHFNPGEPITILFDEIHLLEKKVSNFLLSVLATSIEAKNTVNWEGADYVFDFRKFTFLGATTESQKVFTALKDRLKPVALSRYSAEELQQILIKNSPRTIYHNGALDCLGKYLRTNARSAADMGREVLSFCGVKGNNRFTEDDAEELADVLNLYEFGLTKLEVEILSSVAERASSSLTMLAAKSGLTPQAQRDLERELLAHSLIDIEGKRRVTHEGQRYLQRNPIRS